MLNVRPISMARPLPHADLPERARTLLQAISSSVQGYNSRQRLVREGERQGRCFVVLSGFVHRHRVTAEGQRQITGLYVPGDLVGAAGTAGEPARHSIEAAGPVNAAVINLAQLTEAADADAGLAALLWREALADAAATAEWVVNIGRRTARERILNLFCELSLRLECAGAGTRDRFELPLTQADLADATGLTAVHVNRVIRSLEVDKVIERRGRAVTLTNWTHAASMADFDVAALARSGASPAH